MSQHDALETIKQLSPTLSVEDLSRVALKLIRDQVGADRGTIFVVDKERGEVRSIAADRVVGDISLPIGFGFAGSVAETGETIDTYNPHYDQRFDEKYEPLLNYENKDIFCMPIVNDKGTVVGVIELLNRSRPFTQADRDFLAEVGRQLSSAIR